MEDKRGEEINPVKNGISNGVKKKVDESWKESVGKEKGESPSSGANMPEVTFTMFISGLMMESLIALGEVENPITKKKEFSRDHAKFLIDTLAMLGEKTKNNLTGDEQNMLEAIL